MSIYFSTITVLKDKIVKVTEIKVTIPLYNYGDEIIFNSTNPELIYLFIHESSLRQGTNNMDQWDDLLLDVCINEKNIKKNDVLRFENWNIYGASYSVVKNVPCKPKEAEIFRFNQLEYLDEKKRGAKDYRYQEYQTIKILHKSTQPRSIKDGIKN